MITRRMLLPLIAAAATAACGSGQNNDVPQTGGGAGSGTSGGTDTGAGNGAGAGTGAGSGATPRDETSAPRTLVVVFQRFAADWLNLLVPAGDSAYATLRPSLKVDSPLPLDGYFGLHPALNDLKSLYDGGDLGFITATGWLPTDSRDRSHFFAQSIAEAGARTGVSDGWLGRVMQRSTQDPDIWAAIAAEASAPASLAGFSNAIAVEDFSTFTHGSAMGSSATTLIQNLATIAGDPGLTALHLAQAMESLELSPPTISDITYPATNLGRGLKLAAQAIRRGYAPRVITVTSDDDWDTHVNQASRHAASLPKFAAALRAFHDDLGAQMDQVVLVTMTEFGRKARENFSGTDHGTASSMLVMGKRIVGGRVHGQWPGLNDSALYQGQDLEPTTDFRAVLGEILVRHSGVSETLLDTIFPGGYAQRGYWRNFFAG